MNFIFIGSLLLAYLSVYVSPEKIWFLAFFGLSYPFLLFINFLFFIFWVAKRKMFFVFSLIAILAGWNYLSSYIQISVAEKETENLSAQNSLNLLSFNVRLFDLYQWNQNKNTTHEIFRFVNDSDFDIICFQEFFTRNSGELSESDIDKKLGGKYYSHIDYSNKNKNYNYGVATFSKYPVVNRGIIKFSNSSNISIYTDVLFNDDTIRIFNNHLQSIRFNEQNYTFITNSKILNDDAKFREIKDISFRLRDAFIKRASQAETLSKHIKKSPYPVILCGDFNDVPVSYTYKTLRKNLKDSFIEAGSGIGNTYIGKFPSFRIDFIFYSSELECITFDIHKVKLSDHYPLTSKFYLKK